MVVPVIPGLWGRRWKVRSSMSSSPYKKLRQIWVTRDLSLKKKGQEISDWEPGMRRQKREEKLGQMKQHTQRLRVWDVVWSLEREAHVEWIGRRDRRDVEGSTAWVSSWGQQRATGCFRAGHRTRIYVIHYHLRPHWKLPWGQLTSWFGLVFNLNYFTYLHSSHCPHSISHLIPLSPWLWEHAPFPPGTPQVMFWN